MPHEPRRGLLLVLLSASGYSFLPIWTKYIYRGSSLEALDVMIWRFVIATPAIWLLLALRRAPLPALPYRRLLGLGFIFGLAASSAFLALSRIPASLYTVLVYTNPAMVALGTRALGERLPRVAWLALLLTLVGVCLTVPLLNTHLAAVSGTGAVFALFNAASYALYILLSGRVLRGQQALAHAGATSITGSLLLAVGLIGLRGLQAPDNLLAWGALVALALISTVLPILSFYAGLRRLGAARAAIIGTTEPALTLILAALLLGERLAPVQMVGGGLIFASVLLLQLPAARA